MSKFFNKVSALWKQGWNEIPEVMGSSFFGVIGTVGLTYIAIKHLYTENKTKRYKVHYTIMRSDDERVKMIWRHDNSPVWTSSKSWSGFGSEFESYNKSS